MQIQQIHRPLFTTMLKPLGNTRFGNTSTPVPSAPFAIPADELQQYTQLSREELIEKLVWEADKLQKGEDWKSIMYIEGPPAKYTDEELAQLTWLSDRVTQSYDQYFKVRRGCNFVIFDKEREDLWYRARASWRYGPRYSATLQEAIAVFVKDK